MSGEWYGWQGDDLIIEVALDARGAAAELSRLRAENERLRALLRDDETVRLITDSWYVQQVFDWYLNSGEHRRSVDDWCETCSTPEVPVYHDPWPETSELDVVRAVLAALAGDDQ